MNGDGGNAVSSSEAPQLWVLLDGVLHRDSGVDLAGSIRCQLTAGPEGTVWSAPTRQKAYTWFTERFMVTVTFEQFEAALRRDYPLTHARMVEFEMSDNSLGHDFANIHMMTAPPKQ